MSADWYVVDPTTDEEYTVASCPTCSTVLDGYPKDAIPYAVPFTSARLHGVTDDGVHSHHWNVTYNLSDMLEQAGFMGWNAAQRDLTDTTTAAQHMATVLAVLVSDPDRFRLMNPDNGWGNYFGLIAELCDFVKIAATHPYMSVRYWL